MITLILRSLVGKGGCWGSQYETITLEEAAVTVVVVEVGGGVGRL